MADKPDKDLLEGLDKELEKGVDESTTPKEKKKREGKKVARKVVISIGTYKKLAAAPYEFMAIWWGDHWRLEDWEARDAGQALKEVMDSLGPEWLMKWFPAIAYCIINLEIIARKSKVHKEIKAEKDKAKAAHTAKKAFLAAKETEEKSKAKTEPKPKDKDKPKSKSPKKPTGGKTNGKGKTQHKAEQD